MYQLSFLNNHIIVAYFLHRPISVDDDDDPAVRA